MWIKLIKEQPSEFWNVFYAWHELSGGRPNEKSIGYSESHDQALVGDKTLIFRLADAEMYTGMEKSYHSPSMDFAIDMHKLIRFITASLARGGYLNFMGNEFGHPEWIDFPREGNGWSYHYARRQWSLVENNNLKYQWLSNFDKEMVGFLTENKILSASDAKSIWLDDDKKLYIFERKNLLFLFNMHPSWSQEKVFVKTKSKKGYKVIFSTDEKEFGGWNRIDKEVIYNATDTVDGKGFYIYLPSRSAVVLKKQ
jgi:1,4-alpha-glucan branching enzyme